jgi:phosphoribosylanthranilate isomerase
VKLEIKLCGMKDPGNIAAVALFPLDFMGFIFHADSPRFAGRLDPTALPRGGIKRAGVFVNAAEPAILQIAKSYSLDILQLHGNETPETCDTLRKKGFAVWKTIPVADERDIARAARYEQHCDALLFDTKSSIHGGTGRHFDWNLLAAYTGSTPFFLSGGIGLDDVDALRVFSHPRLRGIDLNSRFEQSPGFKDIAKLKKFLTQFQTQ